MHARLLALLLAPTLAVASPGAAPSPEPRVALLDAMEAELQHNLKALKIDTYDAPYFINYRVMERDEVNLEARFGAIISDGHDRRRKAAVTVRVGDYSFDSQPDPEDEDFFEMPKEYNPSKVAPIDAHPHALRGTLWLLTDGAYKEALKNYLQKKAKRVTTVKEKQVDSFSRAPAVQYTAPPLTLDADRPAWAALARRLSTRIHQSGLILDSEVTLSATHDRVYVVNSEGTRIITESLIYQLGFEMLGQAPDGMYLFQGETLYGRAWGELPDEATLNAKIDEALANIKALAAAPMADPYTGPAILEPEATGVFFHETIGHRLEGERQKAEDEGQTFKGQIGQRILPEFITVRDNPTLAQLNDTSLNGFYVYDTEGVVARDVVLVDKGVLRSFLTSRTPIEGGPLSNGHGRAQGAHPPVARMGNLLVEGSQPVSRQRLREMLLEEVRAQGKPYGLIIRDITGGSTNTSSYGYQAFKGTPRMVYRIDAAAGQETLIRGVEMVGTPLTVVSKIIATSDEVGIFNGFCGAESGYVPVSAVAPATLFKEIELQRTHKDKERAPILKAPWARQPAPLDPPAVPATR